MNHYMGYHKADEWGPYFERARKSHARELSFFTAKQYRATTLTGNRLWIVTGKGTPRQYELACSGIIKGIARSERPEQYRRTSRDEGFEIAFDVDYLPEPVDVSDALWFRQLLAEQQNFSRGLSKISSEIAIASLEEIRIQGDQAASDLTIDLAQIDADKSISTTTKLALTNARLGQGQFRRDLERRWNDSCAVSGCKLRQLLRASHIKPWRSATNDERLDPANGLLLCAHLDALFDTGLISFRDDGRMLLAKFISSRDAAFLQIPSALRHKPTQTEKKYLGHHRAKIFKG